MSKSFEMVRGFYARYRKRGAIVLALIVAIELAAAAAVVFAGRELLDARSTRESSGGRGTPVAGFSAPLSTPSLAVF